MVKLDNYTTVWYDRAISFTITSSLTYLMISLESPCTQSLQILICEAKLSPIYRASYLASFLEQGCHQEYTIQPTPYVLYEWTSHRRQGHILRWSPRRVGHAKAHTLQGKTELRHSTKLDFVAPWEWRQWCRTYSAREAIEQHVLSWLVVTKDTWDCWILWRDWENEPGDNDKASVSQR